MKIIISPYSKKLRKKDTPHPKNYPFWPELIQLLKDHEVIQIGVEGETKMVEDYRFNCTSAELIELCKDADCFISVENFFPHFMHFNFKGEKKGVVIFSKSDPEIFGYPENVNLLKDKKYLRWDQFGPWEMTDYIEEAFPTPKTVYNAVLELAKYYLEVS